MKSKRVTDASGSVVSTIELDPWGGDTNRSSNEAFQPRRFTTYDRDGNASDEAMHRRYNRWHSRFDQPDPYGGSYDMTNPQSFNRYSYVQNDPVNFVDPMGLCPDGTVEEVDALGVPQCVGVGVNPVTINIPGGGQRSRGAVGASDGPIEIETTTDEPTGAELVPQNLCPPTREQLWANRNVQREFGKAWNDSQPGTFGRHEEGGWIFWNPKTGKISVRRAPSGKLNSISLAFPPSVAGAILVASFHTHPTFMSQGGRPDPADEEVEMQYNFGVPGIAVTESTNPRLRYSGILYGPTRAGSDPERAADRSLFYGFPGNSIDSRGCP